MSLCLEYDDQFGKRRRYALRPFEVGTVGSGVADDHYISFDRELQPGHFSLRYLGNRWIVEAGTDCQLHVSGCTVRRAMLTQGDEFKAGRTTFKVEIADSATRLPKHNGSSTLHVMTETESKPPFEFEERVFGQYNMVRIHKAKGRHKQILGTLGTNTHVGLLVNRKAARTADLKLEGWQALSTDLFTLAPEEIRAENSLELGTWDWTTCSDQALENLARSEAIIALFYRQQSAELLDSKKLYWGWFARPSVLWFHLQHVSPMLMDKLLLGLDAISLWDPTGEDLICFGQPEKLGCLMKFLKPHG